MDAGNATWEINYPFPYEDGVFVSEMVKLSEVNLVTGMENYVNFHKILKSHLCKTDYEYMVWQEWKEGFARYIENLCREKLGMAENTGVITPPFNRVSFYETGSRYIESLIQSDNALVGDLEGLFYRMYVK